MDSPVKGNANSSIRNERRKSEFIKTLIGSGYTHVLVDTAANCTLIHVERVEQLGVKVKYLIAITSCRLNHADVASLIQEAGAKGEYLVIVGDTNCDSEGTPVLSFDQFFDRLGGAVFSLLPLDPCFGERLLELGGNVVPQGLKGTADKLFEDYVHSGLQFIFRSRVIQYGQDRRGDPVTDGVIMLQSAPLLLYDAKAAKGGYDVSMESVRQFADYVNEFHKSYERTVGRLTAFLVVSGSFDADEDKLGDRSAMMKGKCGVPLCFLDADTFTKIIDLMVKQPLYRQTIDWPLVFSRTSVRYKDVEISLKARLKDAVLPAA